MFVEKVFLCSHYGNIPGKICGLSLTVVNHMLELNQVLEVEEQKGRSQGRKEKKTRVKEKNLTLATCVRGSTVLSTEHGKYYDINTRFRVFDNENRKLCSVASLIVWRTTTKI
ncbi:hypothetical protein RclHR1_02830006 [Rhizophagus clarus]|uniref:Uncharacterized protein n=1 Tax=Rhizophagus clarus TaxID=94130 RepID=A0A2Z6R3S6_9GLOM|nr:hypothetical protein RclHR1_02830006 [Rhizophagus clarus]GET01356.1 hypothetical protein RCL_jg27137.t1 [Rhizophagus clarus]